MPKPPGWEMMIVWYFFLGGIAGGAYFTAAIADNFGSARDGRVAYESRDASPAYPTLYYKDVSGGTETQLAGAGVPGPDYEQPAYSPDGAWIAYVKKDGNWYHLYVCPAAGGAETAVTSGAAGPSIG